MGFTRNWYNTLAANTMRVSSTDTSVFGDGHINVKFNTGSIVGVSLGTSLREMLLSGSGLGVDTTTAPRSWMCFGTGDAPFSFDDYKLDNPVGLIGANFIVSSPVWDSVNRTYSINISMVLTNNSDNAYTIKEMGHGTVMGGNGVLLYRDVLETPFTIQARESLKYTHKLTFNYPTIS